MCCLYIAGAKLCFLSIRVTKMTAGAALTLSTSALLGKAVNSKIELSFNVDRHESPFAIGRGGAMGGQGGLIFSFFLPSRSLVGDSYFKLFFVISIRHVADARHIHRFEREG